jgi:hypothetical protein
MAVLPLYFQFASYAKTLCFQNGRRECLETVWDLKKIRVQQLALNKQYSEAS